MFVGESTATLDKNNRLILPADFRKAMSTEPDVDIGQGFVLTIGLGAAYLELHPKRLFKTRTDELYEKYPEYDSDAVEGRMWLRDIVSSARPIVVDAQNRFVLPDELKRRAEIDSEVRFVANWDRIEIWDNGRYSDFQGSREGKQGPPPKPSSPA